jgi:hypothetical protein
MALSAAQIILGQRERDRLVPMSRKPKIEARYALRAQITLKAANGISGLEIAKQLRDSSGIVSKWRVVLSKGALRPITGCLSSRQARENRLRKTARRASRETRRGATNLLRDMGWPAPETSACGLQNRDSLRSD